MQKLKEIQNKLQELRDSIEPIERQIDKLEEEAQLISEALESDVKELPHNKEFIEKCESLDVYDIFIDLDRGDDYFSVCEDDGTLHISKGQVHACFISNQELSKKEWKEEAMPILKAFGLTYSQL